MTALSFNAISLAATCLLFGAGEAPAFPAGVSNLDALANPEALCLFENLPDLQME